MPKHAWRRMQTFFYVATRRMQNSILQDQPIENLLTRFFAPKAQYFFPFQS